MVKLCFGEAALMNLFRGLSGWFCALLILSLIPVCGLAEAKVIAISLDREQVRLGRVSEAEIKQGLGRNPSAWSELPETRKRKAVFALFKTLKFHSGPGRGYSEEFFVLLFDGITYCVSWPNSNEEDPCQSKSPPADGQQ
jgi:hypothetical protein